MSEEKIFIGSDHAGFETKEAIRKYLEKRKIKYHDFAPKKIPGDDYPDYAFKVAREVSKDKNRKGILVCGSGTGMVIAANKVKGIRAAVAYDRYSAEMAKRDNDCNIICLRGRKFSKKKDLNEVKIWLSTNFSREPRHIRRIKKISDFEKRK